MPGSCQSWIYSACLLRMSALNKLKMWTCELQVFESTNLGYRQNTARFGWVAVRAQDMLVKKTSASNSCLNRLVSVELWRHVACCLENGWVLHSSAVYIVGRTYDLTFCLGMFGLCLTTCWRVAFGEQFSWMRRFAWCWCIDVCFVFVQF